jgi:putative PIN family toxin of toxin-antitoxin system
MKYYTVIDTNVLVSSMLTSNPDSSIAKIINYVRQDSIIPMFDETILEEYQAVLSRDRFHFNIERINELLTLIKTKGIHCGRIAITDVFPDPDDIVFYEVAMSRDDAYLVTGNLRHFPKNGRVVSPADMVYIIEYGEKGSGFLSEPEGPYYLPISLEEINSIIREVRITLSS